MNMFSNFNCEQKSASQEEISSAIERVKEKINLEQPKQFTVLLTTKFYSKWEIVFSQLKKDMRARRISFLKRRGARK